MSDVVPPGGERPLDDDPWPVRSAPILPAAVDLPGVPAPVPVGVEMPPDWRSLAQPEDAVPIGYQPAGAPPVHVVSRRDHFGVAGCVAGVAGLLQLLVMSMPLIAVLAIALSLAGRRFAQLDPHGVGTTVRSTIGFALGAIGVASGLALLFTGTQSVMFG